MAIRKQPRSTRDFVNAPFQPLVSAKETFFDGRGENIGDFTARVLFTERHRVSNAFII
jgi:hypothetical protein